MPFINGSLSEAFTVVLVKLQVSGPHNLDPLE